MKLSSYPDKYLPTQGARQPQNQCDDGSIWQQSTPWYQQKVIEVSRTLRRVASQSILGRGSRGARPRHGGLWKEKWILYLVVQLLSCCSRLKPENGIPVRYASVGRGPPLWKGALGGQLSGNKTNCTITTYNRSQAAQELSKQLSTHAITTIQYILCVLYKVIGEVSCSNIPWQKFLG
jgi:hypothetical protein